MRIDIITIFPEMFSPVLDESIIKRAQAKGKVDIHIHDLRDYADNKHRKVDDRPFGGGAGMVMCAGPIFAAVEKIKRSIDLRPNAPKRLRSRRDIKAAVILLCPQGKKLAQSGAKSFARYDHLILICGHYEGIDERVRQKLVDEEVSIGDYVLTGGELPAMVLVDAVVRLIPGVLGDKNSLKFESFESNLLEYPQYTRPAVFRRIRVPKVLLSGDHAKIEEWRQTESLTRTRKRRPDMVR
jgi:tRNA (guanine37-N1)-methyltransferase